MSNRTRSSYDQIVDAYVARCFDELEHKPVDRNLLDRFADCVRASGLACDLGCGPGQIARHLRGRGMEVVGVDLSPGMLAAARRLNPGIAFVRADMRALPFADDAIGGMAAFYAIIHIPRRELATVLSEMRRVLRPGGVLLLAFHIGDETVHLEEWWGTPVSVDFHFFPPDAIARVLEELGFTIVERVERDPYPGVEHPSRRAYLWAEKPA